MFIIIITNILYQLQKVSAINKQNRAEYQDVHWAQKVSHNLLMKRFVFCIFHWGNGI